MYKQLFCKTQIVQITAVPIMVRSALVFPAVLFAITSKALFILTIDMSSSPALHFYAFTAHRRYVCYCYIFWYYEVIVLSYKERGNEN